MPKSSAKLGLGPPLENVIPVDADHRELAYFSSRNCKRYGVVRSKLALILSSQDYIHEETGKPGSFDVYGSARA